MSLNTYLWGMKVSTVIAFFAWASVVLYVDPNTSGIFGKSLFFITLFLWFSGVVALLIVWARKHISGEDKAALLLGKSFRQSIFLALFGICLLGLQYFSILRWWSGALAATLFLLVELYFVHHDSVGTQAIGTKK